MDDVLKLSVEHIHNSSTQVVLYVTGGASHALSWLLSVPGASNTILEAGVPYHCSAVLEIIGKEAASSAQFSFASSSAARSLAKAAYRRAVHLAAPGTRVCGIAAACGLATLSKKGDHRAFVATYSCNRVVEYELFFKKNHRARWDEDLISSRLVLQAMLDDVGALRNSKSSQSTPSDKSFLDSLLLSRESPMSLVREFLVSGESLSGPLVREMPPCVEAVLQDDIQFAEQTHGKWNRNATSASLIFPGSFNPLHDGHRKLMETVKSRYSKLVPAFEISVTNPDKPPLEADVVYHRLQQFSRKDTVLVTRAPYFSTKAELFPNSVFVVGVDTAARIIAPRYYGGKKGLISSLVNLKSRGCKFAVAGRLEQRKDNVKSDVFQTMSDLHVPVGFEDMFEDIPFRADISSSEIRARKGHKKGT